MRPATVAVLFLLVTVAPLLVAAQCDCEYRRDVLLELYHATNGSGWNITWDLTLPVCKWAGIGCESGDVSAIAVEANNLQGTLPTSLANLTKLTMLRLTDNNISGTLATEFAAWTSITAVYLSGNNLTGTLPASYSAWGSGLHDFTVSSNSLTGSLPSEYSTWSNVVWFSVGNNQLTGTLPPAFSAWKAIHQFSIHKNQLTGSIPPEYSAWSKMANFYAYTNQLSGILPPELSAWSTTMRVFEAYINRLEGTLPPQYAAWKNLIRMNIAVNRFTGELPSSYSAWTSMQTLIVLNNSLSGTLPGSYSSWINRSALIFALNDFEGPLPSAWGMWRNTPVLSFNNNSRLSGEIPNTWTAGMMAPLSGYLALCGTNICSPMTAGRLGLLGYACPDGSTDMIDSISSSDAMAAYLRASTISSTIGNTCYNITGPPTAAPAARNSSNSFQTSDVVTAVGPLVATSVFVSALASLGTASRTASLQFAAMSSALRSRCMAASSMRNDTDALSPAVSTALESPTQLTINVFGGGLEYAGGAVIGNTLLVVCIGLVLHAMADVVLPWARGRLVPTSPLLRVAEFFGEASLPGTFVTMYSSLVTPTTTASLVLLSSHTELQTASPAGVIVLGVAGLLAVVPLPVFLVWKFATTRPFPAESIGPDKRIKASSRSPPPPWRQILSWLSARVDVWVIPRIPKSSARAFCRSFGAYFIPYRRGWRKFWYFAETGIAMSGGVVAGVAYSQEDPCVAAVWSGALLAALSTFLVVLHVIIRPCNATLDQVGAVSVGLLAAAADISAAAMYSDHISNGFSLAAAIVEIVLIALAIACSALIGRRNTITDEGNHARTPVVDASLAHTTLHVVRSKAVVLSHRSAQRNDRSIDSLLRYSTQGERLAAVIEAITSTTTQQRSE
jgi:hypothetical protein